MPNSNITLDCGRLINAGAEATDAFEPSKPCPRESFTGGRASQGSGDGAWWSYSRGTETDDAFAASALSWARSPQA